jgi:Flp pilus assembly pilin Flp
MRQTELLHFSAKNPGNALVEYGFIGTVVLGGGIAILMLLGTNLNEVFSGLNTDAQSHKNTAASAYIVQETQAANADALQSDVANALMNGASNASTLQVTAANGNTGQFGLFAKPITQYQAPPKTLSPADILAMEREMANRTYMLADVEQKLQAVLNYADNNPNGFMNTTITFQGKTQPAITLAIGLQYEAQLLEKMQTQLNASNASQTDKVNMAKLASTAVGGAASIYSKTQALQSTYQQGIVQTKIVEANTAIKAANASTTVVSKVANAKKADQAIQAAQVAQSVANTASQQASIAAQTASKTGTPPDIQISIAKTDLSAGVMCKTGLGKALNRHCRP